LAFRRSSLRPSVRKDAVKVLRNRFDVVRRHWECRHRRRARGRIRASALHDWRDLLTALVAEHELRPQQVWPTLLPSAQVDAVAGRAVAFVQALPARDYRGVGQMPLLLRKVRWGRTATFHWLLRGALRGRRRRLTLGRVLVAGA